MAESKPEVSFIGLGAMGFGMATHLLKQGYRVTGFDVWAPTLERFAAAGGATAKTPAAAVADKLFCVCMVATAQQAQSVLFEGLDAAVPALPKGATLLLCSTVPCAYVQQLEKQLAAAGREDIHLIDSPVSGGAARAADGTLSIMAGASDAGMAAAKPLLLELADPAKLYVVAGGIGAGSNMKMVHQVLAAVQILSCSEGMGFADHLGLDAQAAHDFVVKSEGWSWMFGHRVPRILTNFQPVASALGIIVKDTGIITSEARRSHFPALMTGTAEGVYFAGLGMGFGPDDDSGMVRVYTQSKGKVGPVAGEAQSQDAKLGLVVDLLKGIHLLAAVESLSFAHRVGLDLDQVLDLCINAAGGSTMLQKYGPGIIQSLRAAQGSAGGGGEDLTTVVQNLQAAIEEAQRLKVPVYLGTQALGLATLASRLTDGPVTLSSLAKIYA